MCLNCEKNKENIKLRDKNGLLRSNIPKKLQIKKVVIYSWI